MGVSFLCFEPQRFDEYANIGRTDANNWSMGPQEGLFLCGLLSAIKAKRVIEIGSNIGHSTLYLCHALRAINHPDRVLHSFETSDRAQIARKHLQHFGYDEFAHVHQANSRGLEAQDIRDTIGPIDAILIDGDHSFEGSYADFCFWEPSVRPGGLFIFHDVSKEFEALYQRHGMRSVHSTIHTIETSHPGFSIMRMLPPHYHNATSMAVVQRPYEPVTASMPASSNNGTVRSDDGPDVIWVPRSDDEARYRPWESVVFPHDVKVPPSMMQTDEVLYAYWLAKEAATVEGDIVEIGPWIGAATAALAQGVLDRKRGESKSKIHVFDRFAWTAYAAKFLPDVTLNPGDDMEEIFRQQTARWTDLIVTHKGELETARWPSDKPISILFIDAPDNADLMKRVWREFGPGLRPGSIVVFQDYKHYMGAFIPPLVYQWRTLKPVHVVRDGCSVGFRLTQPYAPIDVPPMTRPMIDKAFDAACRFFTFDAPTVNALQLSWSAQLARSGFKQDAKRRFERVKNDRVSRGAGDAIKALEAALA